jgi:hypothetical protein
MESKPLRVSRLTEGTIDALDSSTAKENGWSPFIRCLPFLLLALTVFAWGTGYKLSLYKALREDGSTPAKLSTRVGDTAQSALLDSTEDHGLGALISLSTPLCAPTMGSRDLRCRNMEDGQAMNPSPFHPPAALDLRPPPMQLLELG